MNIPVVKLDELSISSSDDYYGDTNIEVHLPSGNKVWITIPVNYLERSFPKDDPYYDKEEDIWGLNLVFRGHYE